MSKVILSEISTTPPEGLTKKEIKKETDIMARAIADRQHLMYAENKKSLLIVFQGMDSSGKDGATRKVFKYCSPIAINAFAFKKPTEKEFEHDFLWRVHKLVPEKGMITIFNRSHYEDILIQRVHNWIDEEKVTNRINAINSFEKLLMEDSNTTILKFYLHLSKDRQEEKLQERIDDPRKNWKHNDNDWKERKHWDDYMSVYEDAINRCNTPPWIIAPVDSRWYRDFFIAKKVLKVLNDMEFNLPVIPPKLEVTDE